MITKNKYNIIKQVTDTVYTSIIFNGCNISYTTKFKCIIFPHQKHATIMGYITEVTRY